MENQTIVLNGLTLDPRVQAIMPALEQPDEDAHDGIVLDQLYLSQFRQQASDESPVARHTFVYDLRRGDEDMQVRITYQPVDEDEGGVYYDVEIQTFSDTNNAMDSALAVLDAVRHHKAMGHDVLDVKA
ncbi:hypothetical protein [Castellaniella sp.]|uniref:hypothetical protein n=1 Tax=Castellaniella sp. TaxID=1955812 RepID=UPI002AFE7B81|nr:hypothetical protein [Castellaniella sp.]